MNQMRHQAKSLTGFWKNLHSLKRVVFFQKSLTYSFVSRKVGLQMKKTKKNKKTEKIIFVKNPA